MSFELYNKLDLVFVVKIFTKHAIESKISAEN